MCNRQIYGLSMGLGSKSCQNTYVWGRIIFWIDCNDALCASCVKDCHVTYVLYVINTGK